MKTFEDWAIEYYGLEKDKADDTPRWHAMEQAVKEMTKFLAKVNDFGGPRITGQIDVERIYSGFMGYPFQVVLRAKGKVLAWSTEDIKDAEAEHRLKNSSVFTSMTDYSDPKIVKLLGLKS